MVTITYKTLFLILMGNVFSAMTSPTAFCQASKTFCSSSLRSSPKLLRKGFKISPNPSIFFDFFIMKDVYEKNPGDIRKHINPTGPYLKGLPEFSLRWQMSFQHRKTGPRSENSMMFFAAASCRKRRKCAKGISRTRQRMVRFTKL